MLAIVLATSSPMSSPMTVTTLAMTQTITRTTPMVMVSSRATVRTEMLVVVTQSMTWPLPTGGVAFIDQIPYSP